MHITKSCAPIPFFPILLCIVFRICVQGAPSFSTLIFHDFSMTKNENPWPIGTTYNSKWTIFNLWMHTRISKPVKTVSSITLRIRIWLYKWSRVTFTELLSAVVKIPWHYHHFPWLSVTFAIFHDFPGLENGLPKSHDLPWPRGTLYVNNYAFENQIFSFTFVRRPEKLQLLDVS